MTWEEGSKCHKLSQAVAVCTEFAQGACPQSDMNGRGSWFPSKLQIDSAKGKSHCLLLCTQEWVD